MSIEDVQKLLDANEKGLEARRDLRAFLTDAYEVLQWMECDIRHPLEYIDGISDDGDIAFYTSEEDVFWVRGSDVEKFFHKLQSLRDHRENLTHNMSRIEAKIKRHFGDFLKNGPIYFVRDYHVTLGTTRDSFTAKVESIRTDPPFKVSCKVEFEFTDIESLDDLFVQARIFP